jgi:YVTN family beta-propeller protein
VANRGSDSVSVVDLPARRLLSTIAVGHRPYGVVVSPTGDMLYVAEQGADQIRILDTANLDTVSVLPTPDRPSGLALTEDGRTLYVTHLLTSTVSVFTVSPALIYLPLLFRGGTGAAIANALPCAIRSPRMTHAIRLWPDSNLVQSIVLSPDGQRAYIPHTRSNTANRALTFDTTVFPLVSILDLTSEQHLIGQQFDLGTLDPPGVGLPFDGAVTPDGKQLWVVNAGSNDISVVDLAARRLTAHIQVGDNPRGIVLAPDAQSAYVNNTLAGTVSILDTDSYTVTATIRATEIPLPPALLRGKRIFHSSDRADLARAQWISCNTCHFDGEQDGRTWTFGFAGQRNTTSLFGMVQTYPLRWSGEWNESADSEFAIRKENFGAGLISGEMNCAIFPPDCAGQPPNQGRSYDLDALALFLDSLVVSPSPYAVDAAVLRGQVVFQRPELRCVECHPAPLYTDQKPHDVGTATSDERIGPAYDTPSLRGLFDSAPYFHDGSAATLPEALTRPTPGNEHNVAAQLTEAEIADLIAFLRALPFK